MFQWTGNVSEKTSINCELYSAAPAMALDLLRASLMLESLCLSPVGRRFAAYAAKQPSL